MRVTSVLLGCALAVAGSAGAQTLITFEEFIGYDFYPISTFYEGINFLGASTGSEWLVCDTNTLYWNVSRWDCANEIDLGWSNGTGEYWICNEVSTFTGFVGDDGLIELVNEDATFVEVRYSSAFSFYLEAYDSADTLVDTAVGPPNLRHSHGNQNGPGTLRVEAPAGTHISYVICHDSGNMWTIDNLLTDASGITTLRVAIDIQPGDDVGCFNNNGHGLVPVAVLGADDFDVTQIDVWSLLFGGLEVNVKPNGSPHCAYEDVSGDPTGVPDGYIDLVCHFVDAEGFEWNPDEGTADLTGSLQDEFGGAAFLGTDYICVLPTE
jgi:hypothetical protein